VTDVLETNGNGQSQLHFAVIKYTLCSMLGSK